MVVILAEDKDNLDETVVQVDLLRPWDKYEFGRRKFRQ